MIVKLQYFSSDRSDQRMNAGTMSHLLMDDGLEMNIGMCPIGTRINFPLKINNTLDEIFASYDSNKDNKLLHTLLIGKINQEQKYESTISKVKSIPD